MRKKCTLVIILLFLASQFHVFSKDLNNYRDSLINILKQIENPIKGEPKRLEVLNNLFDLDLSLGKREHLYLLWEEAIFQNDVNTIDDIALPMALSYQNSGNVDSARVWKERCVKYLPEIRKQNALEYLILMKDLRANDRYNEIIERLIKEKIELDPKKEPFKAMRVLYTLSTLTTFTKVENDGYDLKDNILYLKEALEIAKGLDFRDGFRFHRQILSGMATNDISYARELLKLNQKFYQEDDIVNRPFYSRKGLIMSYERMITNGSQLSRKELDSYYSELNELLKEFPRDTPAPLDYYKAKVNYKYAGSINDIYYALDACDSLIKYATIYKRGPEYHYADKINMLKYLKRWEEAFICSNKYIQIKDSLANVVQSKKLSELQVQYDVDSLKRAEHSRRIQLYMAIFILLLISIILTLSIIYTIRNKKKNQFIISQLKKEAEELQKDILRYTTNIVIAPESKQKTEKSLEKKESLEERNSELFEKINSSIIQEKFYLDSNFNRDMIIEKFGINKNKFAEIFSDNDKSNFADYILELRLRESLILMENEPSLSFNEISDRCGFNVYSSYYRAFIKKYGIKPSEYRRNIK